MACSTTLQNHRFMDQWDTFLVTGFMAMVIICLQDRIVQWRRRLHALTICQKEPRITNDDEPYMFMKDGSKNKSEHLATATLLLRMVSLYCILCCFCCYNACLYTETNNNKFERVMKKNPAEQYHQQRQAKSKPELAESRLSRYTNINTEAPQSSSVAVPQLETWWCVITSYNSFEPTNKLKHNTRESTLLWGLPIIFWIALAVIITQVRVLI